MNPRIPLSFTNRQFLLNGKPVYIFSGAIHYFRVVPEYWLDRLTKAKACGLNTVETYVPWNLHEPKPGCFRSEGTLNIRRFIKMAAELDLYIIFRPGPYICAEWDFGGLPSWLLADPDMKVRSNYKGYQDAVRRYFSWLIPEVKDLQYSSGGPIIAVQVENEYGSYSDDPQHLMFIQELLQTEVTELLVTSDNESAFKSAPRLDGVLPTINGQTIEEIQVGFDIIRSLSDQYPLMVMELWTGWFDHWKGCHEVRTTDVLVKTLEYTLQNNASVNLYMFHGGTNFGFMSGAVHFSRYKSDVTSYDYDAPVTEDGQTTEKFWKVKELFEHKMENLGMEFSSLSNLSTSSNRALAPLIVEVEEMMSWFDLIEVIAKKSTSTDPRFMETFTYENGDIQSYGYIVYRKDLGYIDAEQLALTGHVRDNANILINGQTVAEVDWEVENVKLSLSSFSAENPRSADIGRTVLDIVVENLGRVNFAAKDNQALLNNQRKGLDGPVQLNGDHIKNWQIFALDFCDDYISKITNSPCWRQRKTCSSKQGTAVGPALYKGSFKLTTSPSDYFIRLDNWHKGVVIVNEFHLGRYWDSGPQRTLYLPGPILHEGLNEILIFEEGPPALEVILDSEPCLG